MRSSYHLLESGPTDTNENAGERTPEGPQAQKVTQSHTAEEVEERTEDEIQDIDHN